MKYNFDETIDRRTHYSKKWSELEDGNNGEILPMWIADMDFRVADEILEALKKPINDGVLGYNYLPDSFFESIINWVGENHNWKIKKEWIIFSPGVVPGISIALNSFSEEGEGVLIQPPVYPPFYRVIENNKRKVVENPLVYDEDKYKMDLKDLSNKIDENTKVALICNPHNPVGRVWEKEELEEFGDFCIDNNILIVSDEIHSDMAFKNHKHIPFGSISEKFAMNSVTFMAPSKTFNIAGLYASVAIIPNEKIRNEYCNNVEAMELIHTNIFGAVGFEAAYNHGKNWLEEALIYIEDNADFAVEYIKKNIPQVKTYKPDGTFLLWLDFKALGKSSEEIDDILTSKGRIRLNSGKDYGTGGEGFFRLNIGCPRTTLEEGLKRIKTAIK